MLANRLQKILRILTFLIKKTFRLICCAYSDAKNSAGERNERVCCSVLSCIELIIITISDKMAMVGTAVRSMANRFRGILARSPIRCFLQKKIKKLHFCKQVLRDQKLPSMSCTIEFVKFNKMGTCDKKIKSTEYR
jgi:hypothetical protein